MPNWNVWLQSMVVLSSGSALPATRAPITQVPDASGKSALQPDATGNIHYTVGSSSSTLATLVDIPPRPETQILRKIFSSIPIIRQSELNEQYRELGEALGEMTELDEDEDWKIDTPVYRVACYVAAELRTFSFPAPHLFTHGPKSVVFNWTHEPNNLYLTVSAEKISALISTPQQIQRRLEFTAKELLNPAAVFPALQSAQLDEPVVRIDRAVSELQEFAD